MQVFFSPSAPHFSAIDGYNPDTGRGHYSGKTLSELQQEHPDISIVDISTAIEYDRQRRMTPVTETTQEKFWHMLEALPPCKWSRSKSAEAFHMLERITYDIVDWFVRIDDRFYTFADTDRLSADDAICKASVLHFSKVSP